MKDSAPISLGIIVVAALFGLIAAGVAWVVWEFGAMGSLFVGAIVAIITIICLMLGWRDPAPKMGEVKAPAASAPVAKAAPAPAPAPAPAAAAPVAAAVTATPEPAAAARKKAKPAAKPKAKPAAAKAKPAAAKAKPAAAKSKPAVAKAKPVAADGKPEMLSAPRGGAGDDLKQIKGVGPKLEKMLNTMGVWHFDQVAGWRKKEVEWVDENLEGFKGRVSRDEWVKQAKVLAKGGTTEFSKKVKKGGVY